jgi:hypothetical protein
MKRVFIVLKEDIIDFPPVISIIDILAENSYKVYHLGSYSDDGGRTLLESKGVEFIQMPQYDGKANSFAKMCSQIRFRSDVKKYLKGQNLTNDDVVWLVQAETIFLLGSLVKKYNTICHALEFFDQNIGWKYRALSPGLDLAWTLQHAYKVVCCEYNRAQITKGLFQLDELPVVLPNKIQVEERKEEDIPEDIKTMVNDVKIRTEGKKIILYQGIFLDKERRLEEFCEAMKELSDDYVFIAMGRGSEMYERLKNKYESERVLFVPFIKPPYHLLITQLATIGVLTYFPRSGSLGKTLNPLFCAPNKIFEYSKYGIPMISNDVPALKYSFMEYHCGICVEYPMAKEEIAATIKEICHDYQIYHDGAVEFYKSVDTQSIVKKIVE